MQEPLQLPDLKYVYRLVGIHRKERERGKGSARVCE